MPTVEREGLAETLADALRDMGVEYPFTDADALIAGPLAPILAQADTAAQAVAERDEARRDYRNLLWEMERGGRVTSVYPQETYRQRVAEADLRFFAAQAEAARLTAKVERLRAALDQADTALAPFARHAESFDWANRTASPFPDHTLIAHATFGSDLVLAHFRAAKAARTALAAGQDKTKGGKPSDPSTDAPAAAQEGRNTIARTETDGEGGRHAG